MSARIVVERMVGLALVQDGGRPGRLADAVPRGGALVPESLAAANLAVGNGPHAAGIERFGAITLRAEGGSMLVSDDGRAAITLEPGASITLDWAAEVRARYIGISGGIDVPAVFGGRGTLLVAKLGGVDGRPLAKGDALPIGGWRGTPRIAPVATDDEPVRVVAGPDVDRLGDDALAALTNQAFTLSTRSDRTGTRLSGTPLALPSIISITAPMLAGSIEVPPDGLPIVLGPDHPTTGGYPVLAMLARIDFGRFHRRKLGGAVRFELVDVGRARALWRKARDNAQR